MRWILATTAAAVVAAACLAASPAEAQYGATADGEWRSYAGDSGSTKYSPLDQITADNFGDLEVLWHWQSVDSHLVHSTAGGDSLVAADTVFGMLQAEEPDLWTAFDGVSRTRTQPSIRSLVATPLMVDGVLYVSTPLYRAAAIDARTGETLWVHDPRAYESGNPAIAQWRHRGVAYWENAGDARIVWATGDGFLIAVDAKTGLPAPDFGDNGRVDLMDGVPRATRGERDILNLLPLSSQSPPLVIRDTVHRRLDHQRPHHHPRGDAGIRPRLRRADRAAPVGLPHRAAERRRVRVGHLAGRVVALQRQHQHLVDDERRRGARLGLPADRHADERLLRRTPAGGQPLRREHRGGRRRDRPAAVALPDDPPRSVGLRPAGRPEPAGHHRRRAGDQGGGAGQQAGLRLRLRPRHRRAGLAHRGAAGGDRHRPGGRDPVADPALPDEAGRVRVPGHLHRRPRRLHARDPADGRRRGRGLPAGTALHAADPARHHHAASRRRRRELVGGGRRSRDRLPLRTVVQRALNHPAHRAGAPRAVDAALHPALRLGRPRHAARPAAVEAALHPHDRHRHEHRRARLDDPHRQRRPDPQPPHAARPRPAAAGRRRRPQRAAADQDAADPRADRGRQRRRAAAGGLRQGERGRDCLARSARRGRSGRR